MVLNMIACLAEYRPPNVASTLARARLRRAIDLDVANWVRLFKYSSYRETKCCRQDCREIIDFARSGPVVAGVLEPLISLVGDSCFGASLWWA